MKRSCIFWSVVIGIIFMVLSLYQCVNTPFFGDEIYGILDIGGFEPNGYLYYTIHSYIYGVEETRFYATNPRAISWCLALFTLVGAFAIGSLVADRQTGLYTIFALGSNVAFLAASCYHRFHMMNVFFGVWAFLFLLLACRHRRWYWWLLFGLATLAVVGTLLMGVQLLLLFFLVLILDRRCSKRDLLCFTFIALLCGAWLGYAMWLDKDGFKRFYYKEFDGHLLSRTSNFFTHQGFDEMVVDRGLQLSEEIRSQAKRVPYR